MVKDDLKHLSDRESIHISPQIYRWRWLKDPRPLMAAWKRSMSTYRASLSHLERTAHQPRQNGLHEVILSKIEKVNPNIRLLQLTISNRGSLGFLPGQWLDVFIPGLTKAGGFTITSTPRDADYQSPRDGYVELAIQDSPKNAPAAWLWRPSSEILGQKLLIRVGGSFVWPPPGIEAEEVKRLVLVAGGVGINPLISIFSHIYREAAINPEHIRFLYTSRGTLQTIDEILFYSRIRQLMSAHPSPNRTLELYLTGLSNASHVGEINGSPTKDVSVRTRRISHEDLTTALGPVKERKEVVTYVCGPAKMTDEFVNVLKSAEGMMEDRVLCEKWW
ncbi:hypothetical protein MMC18_004079 [Xylographa bjoerkii]|nr:hypothetical protein [Xylographa bjoerkii]